MKFVQYDNYEKKIKKITRVLKVLFRHKIKIALALLIVIVSSALMTMAVSALMAAKGNILSEDAEYANEIIYGESLDYSAKAFLSDVDYEYAVQGSGEWSENFPRDPGKYEVRAVTRAAVGKKYGEARAFTVVPKQITVRINGTTVTYGEDPLLTSAELVAGDVISGAEFIYNDSRTEAQADADTVVICDAEGKDISSRYDITAEKSEISTVQRPVTLTVSDTNKIYDGLPAMGSQVIYSGMGIAEGDIPQLTFDGVITNVGQVNSYVSCRILNRAGADVTDFYKITTVSGTIKIAPRVITLRSRSFEAPKMYDGNTFSMQEYDIISDVKLVDGDRLVAENWAYITNAGSVSNTFRCYVENDNSGKAVNDNYIINYEYGTLSVSKRPIIVTTHDLVDDMGNRFKYDGTYHTEKGFTVSGEYGLVVGQTATASSIVPSIINAGEENKLENKFDIIIRSGSKNVTDNYEITYVYGILALDKRPITVTAASGSLKYSGGLQSLRSVEISGYGIPSSDNYVINEFTQALNAGTYENKITIDIKNNYGYGTSVLGNYEITYVDGTIVIDPREVTVTPNGFSAIYDGDAKYNTDYTQSGDGFVTGHRLEAIEYTTVTNAERVLNVFTSYRIVDADGNEIPKENYVIEFDNVNYIEVTKRYIVIGSGSRTETYNDELFSLDEVFVFADGEYGSLGLVKDHKIVGLNAVGVGINAGSYKNVIDGTLDIVDGNGNSVLHNYSENELDRVFGWIVIEQRPIAVIFGSVNEMYNGMYQYNATITDGTDGGYDYYKDQPGGLCDGHYFGIDLSVVPKYKDIVDGAINEFSYTINRADGEEVTGNYIPVYTRTGTITITKRPITVITEGYTGVYDGMYHSNDSIVGMPTDGVGGLCVVDGISHSIVITGIVPEFKDVISGVKNVIEYVIVDENGNEISVTEHGTVNVMDNYEITNDFGDVEITKRKIEISTPDYEAVYNGKNNQLHEYDDGGYTENSGLCRIPLTDGSGYLAHRIVFNDDWSPLNTVDEKFNTVTFVIVDEDGNVVWDDDGNNDDNYDVYFTPGEVNISPRPVKLWTDNYSSYVYNGMDNSNHILHNMGYDGNADSGLCEGHLTETFNWAVLKDVIKDGSHTVDFVITDKDGNIVWDGEEGDLVDNYLVEFTPGAVNITPRPILITTPGYSGVYDGKSHQNSGVNIEPTQENSGLCKIPLGGEEYAEHSIEFFDWSPIKTVDEKINNVTFRIVDENGVTVWEGGEIVWENEVPVWYDGSGNYAVTFVPGAVEITKRTVYYDTESNTWVYDGDTHTHGKANAYTDPDNEENTGLSEGHKIVPADELLLPSITNVIRDKNGEISGIDNDFEVIILDENGQDATANYNVVNVGVGKLVVTPRPVTVTSQSDKKPYDGTPLVNPLVYAKKVIGGGLVFGHELVAEATGSQTKIGISDNTYDRDALRIVIKGAYGEEDIDVTGNYDITYEIGTLEVTATLVLKPNKVTKVYDGTPLTHKGVKDGVTGNPLWDDYFVSQGYTLQYLDCSGSQTEEGKGNSHIESFVIVDSYGNVVLTYADGVFECFDESIKIVDVQVEDGILEVTAPETRVVKIYINSLTTTYDENDLKEYSVTTWRYFPGFVLGPDCEFVMNSMNIRGTNPCDIRSDMISANNADYLSFKYTENGYDFTKYCRVEVKTIGDRDYSVLRIAKPITLTAGSASEVYTDGAELSCDTYQITSGALLKGHSISEIKFSGYLDTVGFAENEIVEGSVKIVDEYGEDVTALYNISRESGILELYSL